MGVVHKDTRIMWYGRSGYTYDTEFVCLLPVEQVKQTARDFYLSRRARLVEGTDETTGNAADETSLHFTRGRKFWSSFSPVEIHQIHTIDIHIRQAIKTTTIHIHYHAAHRYGLVIGTNSMVTEARYLQDEIEVQSSLQTRLAKK